MSNSGENNIWSPSRLRTQLAAQKGLAPAPNCYIVWRATTQPGTPDLGGYELPGEPGRQNEAAFERWLIERDLAGPERLSVSVLVIREQLDAVGLLQEGVLERRRGGAEGPYYGNVARVEFTGAAKRVQRYRAARDGRLLRLAAEDDTGVAAATEAVDADAFVGEDAAVHAYLGDTAVILDRRTPTLFEDLIGLSGVIHARRPDGIEIGCGVGWHGGIAYVIAAEFPRDSRPLAPPPDLEAAVADAIRSRDLIRLETRLDDLGFCVIARERGRPNLVTIRLDGTSAHITPYTAGRTAAANADQRRWMTYAETYEQRTVLDSWRDGDGDEIAVVTIDQDQEAWQHMIDADGIELSRAPDNEAAAAVLFRESVAHRGGDAVAASEMAADAAADRIADAIDAAADASVPADSLLTKVLAWSRVTTQLRSAIAVTSAEHAGGRIVPSIVLDQLSALTPPLGALHANFTAGSLNRLIAQARSGAITTAGFAAALGEILARLRDELALTRNVTVANMAGKPDGEPPFGPLVELHFPVAIYDIEEAVYCLALRRPTAAVLHAMKVMRHGLEGVAQLLGTAKLTELTWARLIATVRAAAGHQEDLIETLVRVRRTWRGPGLLPADKYTEAEAEAVLDAVAAFMRALAARFEAPGEAAAEA
jgi:hypothetical protein